ncbi:MAG: hypothetical protein ACXADY_20685 [Candidatus Hodarchaeales archaeon]
MAIFTELQSNNPETVRHALAERDNQRSVPEGTVFKLEQWFSPVKFFEKANKAPSLGHGPMAELGFGEMYFWN